MSRRRTPLLLGSAALLVVVLAVVVVFVVRRQVDDGSPVRGTTAEQRALLAQRVGFGGEVTGGAGGDVVRVTSDADSGPGTLRTAVTGSSRKWVVFARKMTIRLDSPLRVGSNTTVDGRGSEVTVTGHGTYGFVLDSVSNVIIESLTLHDFGDTAKTDRNDMPDAINLDGARGVWIDHNDLSEAGDKLVAVTGSTSAVTVSWNHFHDQEQTFQIGNQATSSESTDQTVTVHHNFFDKVGYRMPVVSYGRAHVYDNYYLDWRLYAVRSERTAQVYLEDNVFVAGRSRRAVDTKTGGNGCNDSRTRCDKRPGALRSVGNEVAGAKMIRESDAQAVFDPSRSYRYEAEPAGRALAARVAADAGPR